MLPSSGARDAPGRLTLLDRLTLTVSTANLVARSPRHASLAPRTGRPRPDNLRGPAGGGGSYADRYGRRGGSLIIAVPPRGLTAHGESMVYNSAGCSLGAGREVMIVAGPISCTNRMGCRASQPACTGA